MPGVLDWVVPRRSALSPSIRMLLLLSRYSFPFRDLIRVRLCYWRIKVPPRTWIIPSVVACRSRNMAVSYLVVQYSLMTMLMLLVRDIRREVQVCFSGD